MRPIIVILHFTLSLLFIATPILGLNFKLNHQAQEKMMCCADMSMMEEGQTEMACHPKPEKESHSCQDTSCSDTCNDTVVPTFTLTIQAPKLSVEIKETNEGDTQKVSAFYDMLVPQSFIHQFWNPPKNV